MSRNFLFNECSSSASASINFPKEININEKKAPTDQSFELRDEVALKLANLDFLNNLIDEQYDK